MLFETMMQHPEECARIAADFAEYMRHDPEADRARIGRELAAILEHRKHLAAEAERLALELASRCSPAEDFAGIPGTETPSPEALAKLEDAAKDAAAEGQETVERLAADIAALDTLFLTICGDLNAEGITIAGGAIRALKRMGMPETLAERLDALKEEHRATIPAKERLTVKDAAELYNGLIKENFISGPLDAFGYYLADQSKPGKKPKKNALSWKGTPSEFAYFVKSLHTYNTARLKLKIENYQPGRNTAALCRAFGIDEKTRVNQINPVLTHNTKPRGRTAKIYDIIDTLYTDAIKSQS